MNWDGKERRFANDMCFQHATSLARIESKIEMLDKRINGSLHMVDKHISEGHKWRAIIVGIIVTIILNVVIFASIFGANANQINVNTGRITRIEQRLEGE